jgi:hypothetical protein
MLFAIALSDALDRVGDTPVLIFFLVILWGMRFVMDNPDVIKDYAARAIRAIGRLFK